MDINKFVTVDQKYVLYRQMVNYLEKKFEGTKFRYKECCTMHKIVSKDGNLYLDCAWQYLDGDIYVSQISPITSMQYEGVEPSKSQILYEKSLKS